jgi:AcrR family transcriptional regulator
MGGALAPCLPSALLYVGRDGEPLERSWVMAKPLSKMAQSRMLLGERRRLQSRQAIVDAAMDVFHEKTPDAAVIGDFITAAGVARGTFYNHFRDVDEVCSAVAVQLSEECYGEIAHMTGYISDPAERVSTVARYFLRRCTTEPKWGWVILRVALHGAMISEFRGGIEPDIEAGWSVGRFLPMNMQVAVDLITGLSTTAMRTILEGDAPPTHAEDVAAIILRGLGVEAEEAGRLANAPLPPLPPSALARRGVKAPAPGS